MKLRELHKTALRCLSHSERELATLKQEHKDLQAYWIERDAYLIDLINKYRPYYMESKKALADEIRNLTTGG